MSSAGAPADDVPAPAPRLPALLIVQATLRMVAVLLTATRLSFLGFGLRPPTLGRSSEMALTSRWYGIRRSRRLNQALCNACAANQSLI